MSILHFIPAYEPAWDLSGPVRAVSALCRALVRAGADVTVVTTDLAGTGRLEVDTHQYIEVGGVRVRYFRGTRIGSIIWSSPFVRCVRDIIRDSTIIHSSATWHPLQHIVARAAWRAAVPTVLSVRGVFNPWCRSQWSLKHRLYWSLVERWNYNHATSIHYTAEAEQHNAEAFLGSHNSFVVPNGISISEHRRDETLGRRFRQKHQIPENATVVLFMGRLHPVKGLDLLIPAFASAASAAASASDPPYLVIAGRGDISYEARLQSAVETTGIVPRVRFVGHIVGDDRTGAFSSADIFVLPSHNENFGMSVVEAMAFGLPSIVTEDVNIASELTNDQAALEIPYEMDALTNSLQTLIGNVSKRQHLAARAQNCVERRYDIDAVARSMLKQYEEVLQRQHKKLV